MKKLVVFLVAVVPILTALVPVSVGAANGDEVWNVGTAGLAYAEVTVNTNNLKTSQYHIVNNWDKPVYLFIYDTRTNTIINNFSVTVNQGQNITVPWVFNYNRQTSDPDSNPLRYPPFTVVVFGTSSPTANGIS